MYSFTRTLITTFLLYACSSCTTKATSMHELTEIEQQNLLTSLADHMSARITDITQVQRLPSQQFLLNTSYPLFPHEILALESVGHLEGSYSSDLLDFVDCRILKLDLQNENMQPVDIADTIQNSLYLQRFGLWEKDQKLSQNAGIFLQVLQSFTALKGSIQLELVFDKGLKHRLDIPVDIKITDVLKD